MNKKRKLSRIGKILIVFLAVFALAGGAAAAGTVTREHVHADPALPGGHGGNIYDHHHGRSGVRR